LVNRGSGGTAAARGTDLCTQGSGDRQGNNSGHETDWAEWFKHD
jgi:hypothetical protein